MRAQDEHARGFLAALENAHPMARLHEQTTANVIRQRIRWLQREREDGRQNGVTSVTDPAWGAALRHLLQFYLSLLPGGAQ